MSKSMEAALGKKKLCNPPVLALVPRSSPIAVAIAKFEGLVGAELVPEKEIRHAIAADEAYLKARADLDAEMLKKYESILDSVEARL